MLDLSSQAGSGWERAQAGTNDLTRSTLWRGQPIQFVLDAQCHAQNRAQKKEANRNSLSQIHRGFIRIAIRKSIKAIDDLFYSSRNRKLEKINGIRKQPKSDKTPSDL